MDDLSYPQKLLAEVPGTAMLVGVGSVPAMLIIGGDAPFTMAQLGMISFAFAMIVVALIYAIGHVSGCQINPAITVALAAAGKLPWRQVPGFLAAQIAGAVLGAATIMAYLWVRWPRVSCIQPLSPSGPRTARSRRNRLSGRIRPRKEPGSEEVHQ
jgi:glycerol uptake facilitator protein